MNKKSRILNPKFFQKFLTQSKHVLSFLKSRFWIKKIQFHKDNFR